MRPIIPIILFLATSVLAQVQAERESREPAGSRPPTASQNPADANETLRFTVELTDGSRILGSPLNDSFPLHTGLGPMTLKWQLVKSVESIGGGNEFLVIFRNDDRAKGTLEFNTFTLHTLLGDLTVPLALTRSIRVESLTSRGGPVVYWSFNDPANLGADDSGNGHVLTVMGAQPSEGRFGKGAATGGPDHGNHFVINSHPDLQFSGDFTLAVWAWRGKPLYDGDQLIAKDGEFSLRRYQLPTERYDVELCEKHALTIAKVSETKSGLPLENWTLIVVCRKDDRLSIRVNDLPAVETKVADGEAGGDSPLYIGSSASGYPWQGKVDEIRKWNRALSEDEQRELFLDPPAKRIVPDQP